MTRKKSNNRVEPKNKAQKEFLSAVVEKSIVFAVGSAGSGKTFLGAAKAIEYLEFGFVDRIVVVRPVVATEDIGFLPGDIKEKLDPYLLPLMDAFITLTNPKRIQDLERTGEIEIAPLAFMRGRTFSNAFIILDEAQNTTIEQMRMFLTRFGEGVKVVITGDLSQSDIKGTNGLQWAVDRLRECDSVHIVRYSNSDVVRSALVKDILKYIDEPNDKNNQNTYKGISTVTGERPFGQRTQFSEEHTQSAA
jgi:phosphate starvation-inducible protein PhoH and related proteins